MLLLRSPPHSDTVAAGVLPHLARSLPCPPRHAKSRV
ncbi:hypothetical protein ACP4OV_013754 [Aristida adscensionis]